MARPVAIIGGLLALIGTLGSYFIVTLGWYTLEVSGLLNFQISLTAFGGSIANPASYSGNATPYSTNLLEILPAILAIIGSILCFIPKKGATIVGGILILLAVLLFGYNLYTSLSQSILGSYITSGNNFTQLLWYSQSIPILGTIFMHIGYGLICTFIGCILGFLGSIGKD
jgi:hypothetical protein